MILISSHDCTQERLLGTIQLLMNEGHAVCETVILEMEPLLDHNLMTTYKVSKYRVFYIVEGNLHSCGQPNDHLPTRN